MRRQVYQCIAANEFSFEILVQRAVYPLGLKGQWQTWATSRATLRDHFVAGSQCLLDEMGADEAGASGYE